MNFDSKGPVEDRYEATVTTCLDILEEFGVSRSNLDIDNTLDDMGLDYIDAIEFSMVLEEQFKIQFNGDDEELFEPDTVVSSIVDKVLELWLD